MDLQLLAKYYFFPWEIQASSEAKKPIQKLIDKATKKGRRCLSHCSNHSYETTADGHVLFFRKGNKTHKKVDYRTTIKQMAESLFITEKQFNLFQ
jgi:hypothetical protein